MGYGPRTYRGDPGLLGSLWGIGKRVAGAVIGRTPVGMAYSAARGIIGSRRPPAASVSFPGGAMLGLRGQQARKPGAVEAAIKGKGRRRRINPANPKALRRAIRRQEGFVKLARKALKGTKYRITTGPSRPSKTIIQEHGPGSVIR